MEAKGIEISTYPEIRGFGLGSSTGQVYSGEKTFDSLTTFVGTLLKPQSSEGDGAKSEL